MEVIVCNTHVWFSVAYCVGNCSNFNKVAAQTDYEFRRIRNFYREPYIKFLWNF